MDFIPDFWTLVAFCMAAFVLAVTPGPDMTLMISRALSDGRRAGYFVVIGAISGIFIHTILVAFGLSALVLASPTAFLILKITGAGYLLWLAIQALRGASSFSVEKRDKSDRTDFDHWLGGLGVNILNPKIILFFMTFLPQFVDAQDPAFTEKLLFLGVLFVVVASPVVFGVVYIADKVADWLNNNPKAMRMLDYCFATVFSLFAFRILLAQAT